MLIYFLESYLMMGQLTGSSSIEAYRIALTKGCRCIECQFYNTFQNTFQFNFYLFNKSGCLGWRGLLYIMERL